MNKDVLFTIYEILHRDLTKQLNAEYLQKLYFGANCVCNCLSAYNICECYVVLKFDGLKTVRLAYNHRTKTTLTTLDSVYTKYGKKRCRVSKNY